MAGGWSPNPAFWNFGAASGQNTGSYGNVINNLNAPAFNAPPAPQAPADDGGGGASYGGYTGYNYAAAAAAARAAAEAAARNEITGAYDSYINQGLGDILNQSNANEANDIGQVDTQFGTQKGNIDTKLQKTLAGLDDSQTQVESSKQQSLRDVGKNYARQLQSGNLMLTQRGAGDSSAVGQLGLGLTTAQAGARGDVFGQANQQFGQIGLQRAGANDDYNHQFQLLQDWQRNLEDQVKGQYADYRTRIEREKAGANLEKATALANLDKALASNLQGKLANFQTTFAQLSQGLQNTLSTSKPALDPNAINQSYQAQAINRQQLPGLAFGDVQSPTGSVGTLAPAFGAKKQDQNSIIGV